MHKTGGFTHQVPALCSAFLFLGSGSPPRVPSLKVGSTPNRDKVKTGCWRAAPQAASMVPSLFIGPVLFQDRVVLLLPPPLGRGQSEKGTKRARRCGGGRTEGIPPSTLPSQNDAQPRTFIPRQILIKLSTQVGSLISSGLASPPGRSNLLPLATQLTPFNTPAKLLRPPFLTTQRAPPSTPLLG